MQEVIFIAASSYQLSPCLCTLKSKIADKSRYQGEDREKKEDLSSIRQRKELSFQMT